MTTAIFAELLEQPASESTFLDWLSTLLSGVAIVISIAALLVTRRFAKADFRRDEAFAIAAKHHRTALSLAAGQKPIEPASKDRVKHLERTATQLDTLGETDLAKAFRKVAGQKWVGGEPSPQAAEAVEELTDAIQRRFHKG